MNERARMASIIDLADKHAESIATMGARAISQLHAAGVSAYVGGEPDAGRDEIVRLDPDGRRFVVEIVPEGGPDKIIRELPPDQERP